MCPLVCESEYVGALCACCVKVPHASLPSAQRRKETRRCAVIPNRLVLPFAAAAARARAEEAAREGAEEALRGNGAAPSRGGEEARRARTGSYTYCSFILQEYPCMQTDSVVPQKFVTR